MGSLCSPGSAPLWPRPSTSLKKNYNAHKRLGKVGFIIAIGVFLSTLYVFIAVFEGWDAMEPFIKTNRLFMLSFAVFLLLAYFNSKDGAKHKRFIFWAIILPIEPIMGRVSDFFMIENWQLFYFFVWHTFFASFFIYDWLSLKRIHPVSWIGLTWFYIAWAISLFS
ncbi:MAG: hypothetical protein RLO81_06885 [Fulvivirga sp.]|uniref:hypothetical protein n=1 Tax=Fulvivirga sp. TaxID=1931237 RepID=UPI0032EC3CFB